MSNSSIGLNNFALQRQARVEDFLVHNYVDRREAISVALRRLGIHEQFGSWKPVVKSAAAPLSRPAVRTASATTEDTPVFSVPKPIVFGILGFDYDALKHPTVLVEGRRSRGTGGGTGGNVKGPGGQKTKLVSKPKVYGPNRRDILSARKSAAKGNGTGLNGQFVFKGGARCESTPFETPVVYNTFASVPVGLCQPRSWTQAEREASLNWVASRSAGKAARRATNRQAFLTCDIELELRITKRAVKSRSVSRTRGFDGADFHAARAAYIAAVREAARRVEATKASLSVEMEMAANLQSLIIDIWANQLTDDELGDPIASIKRLAIRYGTDDATIQAAVEAGFKDGRIHRDRLIWNGFEAVIQSLLPNSRTLQELAENIAQRWNGKLPGGNQEAVFLARLAQIQMGLEFSSDSSKNKTEDNQDSGLSSSNGGHMPKLNYEDALNYLVELGAEHCTTVQNVGYKPTGKVMIAIVAGRPVDENRKPQWVNLNYPPTVYSKAERYTEKLFRAAEPQTFANRYGKEVECPKAQLLNAEYKKGDNQVGGMGQVVFPITRAKVEDFNYLSYLADHGGNGFRYGLVWLYTFLSNFEFTSNYNPEVDIVYDVLVDGEPDRDFRIEQTGDFCRTVRDTIYYGLEEGELRDDAEIAERHGNLVTVHKSLDEVFADHLGRIEFDGEETDRHLFVVVADISAVQLKSKLSMSMVFTEDYQLSLDENGNPVLPYDEQHRCFAGKLDLFHITEDMARQLYNPEPELLRYDENSEVIVNNKTAYWPRWAVGQPVDVLSGEIKEQAKRKAMRSTSAINLAIEAASRAEAANLKNKVEQVDKAIKAQKEAEVAKQFKEDKVEKTVPNPVETSYAEYQCDKPNYAAELKAVADYLATAATRMQVKEHVHPELTARHIKMMGGRGALKTDKIPFMTKYLEQSVDWVEEHIIQSQTADKRGGTPYNHGAWLAYIYILGVCGDASKIHSFYWTVEDVKAIVELLDSTTRKWSENGIPMISCSHSDDGLYIRIHGEVAFYIDNDRMVYEMKRERAFNHTVRLELVPPTDEEKEAAQKLGQEAEPKVNMVVADSLSNFIHFVYTALLPLVANQKGFKTWSNLLPNVMAATDAKLYTLTKDKVMDQDGGAMYALMNSYPLVVAKDFVPFDNKGLWPELKGEGASSLKRMISELYVDFESVNSLVNPEVMVDLLSKYNLDFHFTKTTGVTGGLGHVSIKVVKQCAPTLFANIQKNLGLKDENLECVVANTLKAEKGMKRVLLSLAQAADVHNGEYGGWQLYMQPKRVKGARIYTAYAPTFVNGPGMTPFIGSREELPVCHTPKVTTNYAKSGVVNPDGQEHPFLFGESNVESVKTANWTVHSEGEYSYVTPDQEIILKGDRTEIICAVYRGGDVDFDAYIYHEKQIEGTLKYLRWKETNSMTNGVKEVVVDYMLEWTERDPKARSIQKAQFVLTDRRLLHNKLNEAHAERLSNVKVQQITLQDALKADATYSWLMVIGNTISANVGSDDPVYRQMFAEAKAIAKSFGKPFDDKDPVLWIDPAATLDGETYEPLKGLFFKTFSVDAVWLMWEQSGPLAENLYTMYTNLVEAGKWHRIENPAELVGKPAPRDGGRWVSYAESKQEDIKGDTNILSFMLDGQGNVLNYAQRGRMFIGTETLHLANVELWETSTVKEAVSGSTQMSAFVKALSAVIDDKKVLKTLQRNLFREGAETMMRLKMLMSMEQGNRFGITHEGEKIPFGDAINLNTVKDEDGKGRLVMSQNDRKMLLALLKEESGVEPSLLTSGGSQVFKDVTFAFRNIVFQIDPVAASDYYGDTVDHGSYWDDSEYEEPTDVTKSVTSWWLPALMSLSKLSTNSEENRDFVSIFFRSVLVPLLLGKSVDSVEVNRMLGVFKNFLASKNTVKLLNGRRSSGAKRIGMPNIPFGEVWVLYSKDTNSVYQQMKRDGIDVDAAYRGELVYVVNNRAPMPVGYIGCLRIVEEKDGEQFARPLVSDTTKLPKLFYKISPVQIGVDLLAVYFDGGDFDGDGHYCVSLKELSSKYLTKIQQLFAMRESALGKDMLSAECGTYFRDHYAIKSWSAATATLLNLKESVKAKALKTLKKYSDYNYNAFGVQNIGVGVMYSVYMLGEILVDFALHLKAHGVALPAELKVLTGEDAESLVVVAAEIYEIMLGGYDEKAVELRNLFLEDIKGGKHVAVNETNTAKLAEILKGMKANASKAREVLQIMSLVAKCYAINKGKVPAAKPVLDEKGQVIAGGFNSTEISHWLCSAVTVYELNRGNFDGFNGIGRPKANGKRGKGHRTALTNSFKLVQQLKANGQGALVFDCMPLFCLDMLHEHLGSELLGKKNSSPWSLAELNYFLVPAVGRGFKSDGEFLSILDAEVVPVEEDEDEDGPDDVKVGTGNTPPDDNDDNGGDDIMEPVTLEEVKAESVEPTEQVSNSAEDCPFDFDDTDVALAAVEVESVEVTEQVSNHTELEEQEVKQPTTVTKPRWDVSEMAVSRIRKVVADLFDLDTKEHYKGLLAEEGLDPNSTFRMAFENRSVFDRICLEMSESSFLNPKADWVEHKVTIPQLFEYVWETGYIDHVCGFHPGISVHDAVWNFNNFLEKVAVWVNKPSTNLYFWEAYNDMLDLFPEDDQFVIGQSYLGLWREYSWMLDTPVKEFNNIIRYAIYHADYHLQDHRVNIPAEILESMKTSWLELSSSGKIILVGQEDETEAGPPTLIEQSEGSVALPMSDDEFKPCEPSMDGWDDDFLGVEIDYDSDPADDFEGDFYSMPPDGVEVEGDLDMSTPVEAEVEDYHQLALHALPAPISTELTLVEKRHKPAGAVKSVLWPHILLDDGALVPLSSYTEDYSEFGWDWKGKINLFCARGEFNIDWNGGCGLTEEEAACYNLYTGSVTVKKEQPAGAPAAIADLDSALTTIQAVSNTLPSDAQAKIAELLAELNRTILSANQPAEAAPTPAVVESAPAAPAVDISREALQYLRNPKVKAATAPVETEVMSEVDTYAIPIRVGSRSGSPSVRASGATVVTSDYTPSEPIFGFSGGQAGGDLTGSKVLGEMFPVYHWLGATKQSSESNDWKGGHFLDNGLHRQHLGELPADKLLVLATDAELLRAAGMHSFPSAGGRLIARDVLQTGNKAIKQVFAVLPDSAFVVGVKSESSIKSGTRHAVSVALDRGLTDVFVFFEGTGHWYRLEEGVVPSVVPDNDVKITSPFAVIGSRNITAKSEVALIALRDRSVVGVEQVSKSQSLALRGNRQVSSAPALDMFAEERVEVDRKVEQTLPQADPAVSAELEGESVESLLKQRVAKVNPNCPAEKIQEALSAAAVLGSEQVAPLKSVLKGHNGVLTGQGGAGKTFTSSTIIEVFKTVGLPILTTGTTTSSVVNIGGDGTFNSIFGLGFDAWGKTLADCIDKVRTVKDFDRLVDKLTKNRNICYKLEKLALRAKKTPILVVVDEVSMLDSLLLSVVDTFLHKIKIKVQWLLVGDPLQFEPVDGYLFNNDVVLRDGVKNVLQPSPTNSTVAGRQFVNFNLKQNRRVVGSDARVLEWLKALDDLRMGEGNRSSLPSMVYERIEFSKSNPAPAGAIHIAFNNRVVERMNSEQVAKLMNLGAQDAKFKANVVTRVGVDPEWYLKKRRNHGKLETVGTVFEPIEEVMTVVQGMPVIFRQRVDDSNGKMLVANSETGTVKGWHKTQGTWYIDVKLDRDGSIVPVKQVKLNLGSEYDKKGEVYQFPITAAFAISINKAQGLTISRPVVIHTYQYVRGELKPLTQNNALYVALSRVTSPDLVYFYTAIDKDVAYLATESFVTNKETVAWVRSFN